MGRKKVIKIFKTLLVVTSILTCLFVTFYTECNTWVTTSVTKVHTNKIIPSLHTYSIEYANDEHIVSVSNVSNDDNIKIGDKLIVVINQEPAECCGKVIATKAWDYNHSSIVKKLIALLI